jgi:hypothetical protein
LPTAWSSSWISSIASRLDHRHLEWAAIGGGMRDRLIGVIEVEAGRFELIEIDQP